MSVSYDVFTKAFLSKVQQYDFIDMDAFERQDLVDGYMKRSIANFKHICKYDFSTTNDDVIREFLIDVEDGDLDELIEIISEGMLEQFMKQFVYRQDNLENFLNTRDFSRYSPAELLFRVGEAFKAAHRNFIAKMYDYSFNHGDLTVLHL